MRENAQKYYQEHKELVKCQTALYKATDKTGRQKNAVTTRKKLAQNPEKSENNRIRSRINTSRRLEVNAAYRELNCARANVSTKKRLANNKEYHKKCIERAKAARKAKLQQKGKYWKQDCIAAAIRKTKKRTENEAYRKQHNNHVRMKRNMAYAVNRDLRYDQERQNTKVRYTARQMYWIKRTRQMSLDRKQQRKLSQQRKMQSVSSAFLLDVKLLFDKSDNSVRKALNKLKNSHATLSDTVVTCLDKMSKVSNPNEQEVTAAFGDVRTHTKSSEPYYYEQVYKKVSSEFPIPVDTSGCARLFIPRVQPTETTQPQDLYMDDSKNVKYWYCNPDICNINSDMITGTIGLLHRVSSTSANRCLTLYVGLNQCQNPNRTNSLGHPLDCTLDCNCSSLLRPARLLSCHFPVLRNIVNKIYANRRIALAIKSVENAVESGRFDQLKYALKHLLEVINGPMTDEVQSPNTEVPDVVSSTDRCQVEEDQLMNQFGKALRQVVDKRDTYCIKACDVCEQLKSKLATVKSYENRKGFNSEKMMDIIDLLYINKTRHENVDEFLNNTYICSFCADKLRGNRDVAQSVFNHLSVIPTPACIKELNLFERSLIKQCVTSISVVRLGQVSNKSRPPKELNSALKGRIAYLPTDVKSNATFLPENLLNTDNLVLLVGSQPTSKQKIWTSAVNLQKVHSALAWLREHNPLYKDVPVYTLEDIKQIINDRLEGHGQSVTTDASSSLLKKLDDASRSSLYEHFTIQPLSAEYPSDAMIDYQMNKVTGQSINIFDTNLDLMAYPELFPTGVNGIRDSLREVKIGTSDYIKTRLLNKDPKFRLNISYLFHCFQTQEVSNMCHSVGHMLRTVSDKHLTAQEFHNRLQARDGEMQSKMFTLLANLRGSKEYFAKLGMDIRWMIQQLGPPTLFITCSTAEWFSEPLISHIRNLNKDGVTNVDLMTPAELCALDPVTVSIHFQKKWQTIFTNLINSKETPLFCPVADYFWRIEYQNRGAPHVHCVLWIDGAPVLGKNTPDEVKQYIDKVITCEKPNAATSPTLSNLVSQFQEHKCNSYCQKSYKHNGKFFKKCRFGFPRPAKHNTELNDPVDCLAMSKSKQPRKRLYHLTRSSDESQINDYNPALLLANQANVDVQYIGHVGSRLPYYITEYMTKHERSEQDNMWQDIFSTTRSLGTNAMSFILKSVKSRQVGANEAADRLLGHKLYSKSRQMRFADLQPSSQAKRVLKSANEINQLLKSNPDSQDIFLPHWVFDIYPARPEELENTSLHEFLGWYEREKVITRKEPLQVKGYGFYLRRRSAKPYIVTHRNVNPHESQEKKEQYFYQLLKLFKPWRSESDLCLPSKTYSETFLTESSRLPEMVKYSEYNTEVQLQEEEIETAVRQRVSDILHNDLCEVDHGGENAMEGCAEDQAQNAMQDVIEAHKNAVQQDTDNCDDLNATYNTLNVDQKRVVDKILHKVVNNETIHLLVSGQGGTGKSRVIDVVNRMVTREMKSNVLPTVVTAPTGLAAFNVNGTTIHRILSLPIEHGKPANYGRLGQEQLLIIRQTLRGLRLLICDELSMVSSLTLLYMHLRLCEIFNCSELFGGISVLFFADLLQLPPVKGNQPFIDVSFEETKQRIGAIGSLKIWSSLEYDELTFNMRQSSDQQYRRILSEVRVGKITKGNENLLATRLIVPGTRAALDDICNRYNTLTKNGENLVILLPRTAQCNEINKALLQQIGTQIFTVSAIDIRDTIVSKGMLPKVTAAYKKMQQDSTRTAGLESTLQLCVGAKIMLRRNKSVEAGLVNGSVGTVVDFIKAQKQQKEEMTHIVVKFDNIPEPVKIERDSCTFEVLKSVFYTRKQFPLVLAFSITIHKSQGLSLKTAIVDAGPNTFGSGMTYVALSRVTTLNGLHLIDLDRTKIQCDQKAVLEYNRLRKLYTPQLGNLVDEAELHTSSELPKKRRKTNKTSEILPSSSTVQTDLTDASLSHKPPMKRKKCHKTATTEPPKNLANGPQQLQREKASLQTCNIPARSPEVSIFQHCDVVSLQTDIKHMICGQLNLKFFDTINANTTSSKSDISQQLQQEIYKQTGIQTTVKIFPVRGDGNCLFRALSLAVTGSQRQHPLLRMYTVNHMLDDTVTQNMREVYERTKSNTEFNDYLVNMEKLGTWGTDQEIVAAANLFNCSIICYSKYSSTGQLCLQHFPPHFPTMPQCTSTCHHRSLYLINRSGSHYEAAIVCPSTSHIQQQMDVEP